MTLNDPAVLTLAARLTDQILDPPGYLVEDLLTGLAAERLRLGQRPYVVTLFQNDFDYDGLNDYVFLLESFDTQAEATAFVEASARKLLTLQTSDPDAMDKVWRLESQGDVYSLPGPKDNSTLRAVYDNSYKLCASPYDSIYNCFRVIGRLTDFVVCDGLLDFLNCENELWHYFVGVGGAAIDGTPLPTPSPRFKEHSVADPAVYQAAARRRLRSTPAHLKKVALVSHDYNVLDSRGRCDYSEHFARINKLCDEQGCDTILYALYTWERECPVVRTHEAFFADLKHIQQIILEVWQAPDKPEHVELWQLGHLQPRLSHQHFATSSASDANKRAFIDDLENRRNCESLLVICGETNIASTVRGSEEMSDPYRFGEHLRDWGIRLVLNPIHDYMRRPEMRSKRRYYSTNGKTVVSVWNKGKGKEPSLPWTVYHDGEERTDAVRELPTPFSERPDIRIGIVDVAAMSARSAKKTNASDSNCKCFDPQCRPDSFDQTDIGVDETYGRFGNVELYRCKHCGRCWIRYFVEYEAFSKSGRWYRGLITPEQAASVTPENAVAILSGLPWHFYGGSYFDSCGDKGVGAISV